MKRALAQGIVRFRLVIMVVLVAVAAWCATMVGSATINYDLNQYLAPNTMTRQALEVMEEEFGSSDQLRVMFVDLDEDAFDRALDVMRDLPGVRLASHDPDAGVRQVDGRTYRLATLMLDTDDATALVTQLRSLFPEAGEYYVGGSPATLLDVQASVAREMPLVMLIAVAVVLGVLLLTSHAWMEPLAILIVLGVSIVINMGTNFVFPSISFITFSVSAVLQLALSIDYAIMLLHAYNGLRDGGAAAEDAMVGALVQSFMRISSSALTTVAGLLSLLFMSFTIGFDIGLALSKGILVSMLCVFLLMPGVVLLLRRPLEATRHTPLRLGGAQLAGGIYRARGPVAGVLALAVVAGAVLSSQNAYISTEPGMTSKSQSIEVNRVFGSTNPLVVLVPGGDDDADLELQRQLVDDLLGLRMSDGEPAVKEVSAMVTTAAAAYDYYTADDVAQLTGKSAMQVKLFFKMQGLGDEVRADRLLDAVEDLAAGDETVQQLRDAIDAARTAFVGPRYTRMLLNLGFTTSDPDFTFYMESILGVVGRSYGQDFYVTGTPMSSYDIGNAFQGDLLTVNVITLLAILAIVCVSFRALRLPLVLVFVIEGAIWINMGFSRILGEPVFFVSYLICLAIQMGATIDYGILLSDQYRQLRRGGAGVREALTLALERALPTVLTSGIILTAAGYAVGRVCSVYYISSIGLLLSRGAAVSVVLMLTLLPALLAVCDRFLGLAGRAAGEAA